MPATAVKYLKCKVIVDEVIDLPRHESAVMLKQTGLLPYDYLVICTGSRYRPPIDNSEHVYVVNPLLVENLHLYRDSTAHILLCWSHACF